MMHLRHFVRLTILLIGFTIQYAHTNPTAATIRIAVPDNFPPFYYRDENGKYKGASYEIVTRLCQKLGYDIKTSQLPSMRILLSELGAGRQDLAVNLTPTPERVEIALFTTTPHLYETQDFIVRADSNIEFDGNLVKMAKYQFGPIFGWTYGPQFDNASYIKKTYVNQSEDQLRNLLAGSFDIAVNNRQFFNNLTKELGVSNAFRILEPSIYQLPVNIAVSHKYPKAKELISALNKELILFIDSPEYQEILSRYGFDLPPTPKAME